MDNWIHITFQNQNTDDVYTDSIKTTCANTLANAIAQWVANGWIILGIEFEEQAKAQKQEEPTDQELADLAALAEFLEV